MTEKSKTEPARARSLVERSDALARAGEWTRKAAEAQARLDALGPFAVLRRVSLRRSVGHYRAQALHVVELERLRAGEPGQ